MRLCEEEEVNMVKLNSKSLSDESMINTCDGKSIERKEKSFSSSTYFLSHQSKKKKKNNEKFSSPHSSFENSFKRNPIKRRSTISNPNDNEQIIEIIDQNNDHHSTTQIKLSLPIVSTRINQNNKYLFNSKDKQQNTDEEEEFTLPTNPPITVTIQPQRIFSTQKFEENSFHDDHLCSPHLINQQRISFDSSSKNSSTIVNYLMDLLKPSDNKLAMKLFGSRKGVLKERLRQQRAGHCIIHPCSNFRFYSQRKKNLFINFDLDFIGI